MRMGYETWIGLLTALFAAVSAAVAVVVYFVQARQLRQVQPPRGGLPKQPDPSSTTERRSADQAGRQSGLDRLEEYHEQGLHQARVSFLLSIIFACIGFVMVAASLAYILVRQERPASARREILAQWQQGVRREKGELLAEQNGLATERAALDTAKVVPPRPLEDEIQSLGTQMTAVLDERRSVEKTLAEALEQMEQMPVTTPDVAMGLLSGAAGPTTEAFLQSSGAGQGDDWMPVVAAEGAVFRVFDLTGRRLRRLWRSMGTQDPPDPREIDRPDRFITSSEQTTEPQVAPTSRSVTRPGSTQFVQFPFKEEYQRLYEVAVGFKLEAREQREAERRQSGPPDAQDQGRAADPVAYDATPKEWRDRYARLLEEAMWLDHDVRAFQLKHEAENKISMLETRLLDLRTALQAAQERYAAAIAAERFRAERPITIADREKAIVARLADLDAQDREITAQASAPAPASDAGGAYAMTAVTLVAGAIVEAVAGLFFVQSNRARRLMTEFFDRFRADQRLEQALRLANGMSDAQLQSRLHAALALSFGQVALNHDLLGTVLELVRREPSLAATATTDGNTNPVTGPAKPPGREQAGG